MTDLGLCPCGGRIAASRISEGVSHQYPPCQKFIDLEPLEFLKYVRRSRGISDEEAEALEYR
jgi:hypothetical protein